MQTTSPKKFVFVVMKFGIEFKNVYELAIKPACEAVGAYCERLDEQIFQESMLERLYNQINKADIIISDMTERSANVFYETGYAHALNKTVIPITQSSEDIPFDLKHFQHIIYNRDDLKEFKEKLIPSLSYYLNNQNNNVVNRGNKLNYYINFQIISNGCRIPIYSEEDLLQRVIHSCESRSNISVFQLRSMDDKNIKIYVKEITNSVYEYYTTRFSHGIKFTIHNPNNNTVPGNSIKHSLSFDSKFKIHVRNDKKDKGSIENNNPVKIFPVPGDKIIVESIDTEDFWPQSWKDNVFPINFRPPDDVIFNECSVNFIIRTNIFVIDINFTLYIPDIMKLLEQYEDKSIKRLIEQRDKMQSLNKW